jgi:hypothetical protein
MLELFFGEALRATSQRPNGRRHKDSVTKAIDQTTAFIKPYVDRCRVGQRLAI